MAMIRMRCETIDKELRIIIINRILCGLHDVEGDAFIPHAKRVPSNTSINALAVRKKGRPKMSGTLLTASISRLTKSMGKTNLSTFTNKFSTIPRGRFTDLSANDMYMCVGTRSPRPSF
jgi:hypothetical protein